MVNFFLEAKLPFPEHTENEDIAISLLFDKPELVVSETNISNLSKWHLAPIIDI